MQLKSVVLPAPLGPMSPTISRGSIESVTSRLATRPPKRLVVPVTERSGAIASALPLEAERGGALGLAGPAGEPPDPAPPRQGQEPVRPPPRDQHDDRAVDDQVDPPPGQRPGAERGGHDLGDRDQDDRSEHRAPDVADAAHHR